MDDLQINLLPWRQERRDRLQREFLSGLALMPLIAALVLFGVDRFYAAAIDTQQVRNDFLKAQVGVLGERIAEIAALHQRRNQLRSRIGAIRALQGDRPIIVRVFDELARRVAPGVYFTRVEMTGQHLVILGVAESNTHISSQLREFSESAWLDSPNVTEITAMPTHGPQAAEFELSLVQVTPPLDGAPEAEVEKETAAGGATDG